MLGCQPSAFLYTEDVRSVKSTEGPEIADRVKRAVLHHNGCEGEILQGAKASERIQTRQLQHLPDAATKLKGLQCLEPRKRLEIESWSILYDQRAEPRKLFEP